jgi:hypothetical protein
MASAALAAFGRANSRLTTSLASSEAGLDVAVCVVGTVLIMGIGSFSVVPEAHTYLQGALII